MKYYNKLIFEISEENRIGYNLEKKNLPKVDLPQSIKRSQKAELPEVSEFDPKELWRRNWFLSIRILYNEIQS